MKLSEKLKVFRAYRPDEWTMDEFIRGATELEKERLILLSCLLGISNECIGEIAMNYKLDAQMIGESIYTATGKTNPELAKALREQGE